MMPILPDPERLDRVRVQPNASVASYSGAEAPALALAGIGADVRKMAEYEQNQLDDLRVTEAITKLRQKEIELSVGDNGYAKVSGSDVLSRPLAKEYGDQHDQATTGLLSNLTGKQRARFEQAAAQSKAQFQSGVMRHSLIETDKAHLEVHKRSIDTLNDKLAKQANDPMAVAQSLADIEALTRSQLARQGYKDGVVVDTFVRAAVGNGHATVINSYIQSDQLSAADAYLRANEERMTADQVKSAKGQLKPLTDHALGNADGAEMFKMKQAGKSETEIASYLLEKAKGNPGRENAAKTNYAYLQAAEQKDDQQKRGSYYMAYNNGESAKSVLDKVRKDRALNDVQRNEIIEHVEAKEYSKILRQQAALGREAAAIARSDRMKARDPNNVAEYYRLASSPDFKDKTPEQLAALEPTLGGALVDSLMKEQFEQKEAAKSGAAVFKIDQDLISGVAVTAGITKKEQRDAFEGVVEISLREWKDRNPGKTPTTDQVKDIIYTGTKKVRDFTGWDTTTEAYKANDPRRAVPQSFYEAQLKAGTKDDEAKMLEKWSAYRTGPARGVPVDFYAAQVQSGTSDDASVARLWQGRQSIRNQLDAAYRAKGLPPPPETVVDKMFNEKKGSFK